MTGYAPLDECRFNMHKGLWEIHPVHWLSFDYLWISCVFPTTELIRGAPQSVELSDDENAEMSWVVWPVFSSEHLDAILEDRRLSELTIHVSWLEGRVKILEHLKEAAFRDAHFAELERDTAVEQRLNAELECGELKAENSRLVRQSADNYKRANQLEDELREVKANFTGSQQQLKAEEARRIQAEALNKKFAGQLVGPAPRPCSHRITAGGQCMECGAEL